MSRRHADLVHLYSDETIFNPSWKFTDEERSKMLSAVEWDEYNKAGFNGVGFHLYSSVPQWDDFRTYMDKNKEYFPT
jgi:hypothetical protein